MELWLPTHNFYEVSDQGRVRRASTGRVLAQTVTPAGYHGVCLSLRGGVKFVLVHRLVAEAFIPNPNHATIVLHRDGDRSKNCADNLRWSVSNPGNSKPVRDTRTGEVYPSVKAASEATGIKQSVIREHCSGSEELRLKPSFEWLTRNRPAPPDALSRNLPLPPEPPKSVTE